MVPQDRFASLADLAELSLSAGPMRTQLRKSMNRRDFALAALLHTRPTFPRIALLQTAQPIGRSCVEKAQNLAGVAQ